MTMEQSAPPPFGYFLGKVPSSRRAHVLEQIAEQAVTRFQTQLEAAWDALGLVKAPPVERLAMYRMKPQAVWDEQLAKYPSDFQEDWADYQALIAREVNGDFL